jgi:hypothetical protein
MFYKNLVKRVERDIEEHGVKVDVFLRDNKVYVIAASDNVSITLAYVIYLKSKARGFKSSMFYAKEVSEDRIPSKVKEIANLWVNTRIGWYYRWVLENLVGPIDFISLLVQVSPKEFVFISSDVSSFIRLVKDLASKLNIVLVEKVNTDFYKSYILEIPSEISPSITIPIAYVFTRKYGSEYHTTVVLTDFAIEKGYYNTIVEEIKRFLKPSTTTYV